MKYKFVYPVVLKNGRYEVEVIRSVDIQNDDPQTVNLADVPLYFSNKTDAQNYCNTMNKVLC